MRRRVVGYGRFSNAELQNSSSTVDQRRNIEVYAENRGYDLVAFQQDDGITGATLRRPGLQEMLRLVERGEVDIVVVEDIDRLGRDEEHLQYLKKFFKLHDVEIHTLVCGGKIDDMLFSFMGILSEQARGKIAYQTRRALVGNARAGRSTGGRTLGYRTVSTINAAGDTEHHKVVDPDEAEVVLDIFRRRADGHSLNAICRHLERTGVQTIYASSKRETTNRWNPSTLSGNVERGEGVLNNTRYIGEIVFNRRNYREVPDGGGGFNRRPRSNPAKIVETTIDESQRIVPQALWDAVRERQVTAKAARDDRFNPNGNVLARNKPPAHLLSGLVVCGSCGARYISVGAGKWRCRDRSTNGCSNSMISAQLLTDRVLAGLRDKLLQPELIARFATKLQQELKMAAQESGAQRGEIERRLGETRSTAARLARQLEDKDAIPRIVLKRLAELELQEDDLVRELAVVGEPALIRLPANYERVYRSAMADLEGHLASDQASTARDAIRKLVEKVVVMPGNARGTNGWGAKERRLELHGDLFRMLDFAAAAVGETAKTQNDNIPRHRSGEGCGLPLVAGTGPTTRRAVEIVLNNNAFFLSSVSIPPKIPPYEFEYDKVEHLRGEPLWRPNQCVRRPLVQSRRRVAKGTPCDRGRPRKQRMLIDGAGGSRIDRLVS